MLTHAYLMIGSPGESVETIEKTRELIEEIRPFSSNISVTTPYPGTYVYESLMENNILGKADWDKYDHLLSETIHIKTNDMDNKTANSDSSSQGDANSQEVEFYAKHQKIYPRKVSGIFANLRVLGAFCGYSAPLRTRRASQCEVTPPDF